MSGAPGTYRGMSAEWWAKEADRYCTMHIAAHQRILRLEVALRQSEARRALGPIYRPDDGADEMYVGD